MDFWLRALLVLCAWLGPLGGSALAYTVNTTDAGDPIRWSVDSVGLRLDPALEEALPPGDAFAAVRIAFEAWRGLPRVPDLIVKHGEPSVPGYLDGPPSNGVYLMPHWEHSPRKLAVTVVTFELETGRLLDADVLINPDVDYRLLAEEGSEAAAGVQYDLAAVLTHEAGHVLGLGESDDDPAATMWPYANPGDMHQRTLTEDDEDGVIDAYSGPAPAPAVGCGGMRVASGARNPGPGLWWVVALAAGLWALLRRRVRTLGRGLCFGMTGLVLVAAPDARPETTESTLAPVEATSPAIAGSQVRAASSLARERLREFAGSADRIELGEATLLRTERDAGFLRTRYSVRTEDGRTVELSVPGGALDGIGQRVVGEDPLPADRASIAIAAQPDGRVRWAHHDAGMLRGGALGEAVPFVR